MPSFRAARFYPTDLTLMPGEEAQAPWSRHVVGGRIHVAPTASRRRGLCDLCGSTYLGSKRCNGGPACPLHWGHRRRDLIWLETSGMWLPASVVDGALIARGMALSMQNQAPQQLQSAGIETAGTGESSSSAEAEASAHPPPVSPGPPPAGAIAFAPLAMPHWRSVHHHSCRAIKRRL